MYSKNSLRRRLISLIIALIFAVLLSADNSFAQVSISCQVGPPTWKWTIHLQAGDTLRKNSLFTLVFGAPVTRRDLITPAKWKINAVEDNRVQWKYTGSTIRIRHNSPVAQFGYQASQVVNGNIRWRTSFPRNSNGETCGPVSLTSPRNASLVAPSAQVGAVTAFVAAEDGSLESADGTVTISFPADSEAPTEEIIYVPQSETKVDNFTVVRSFTLDTYEEDEQPKATDLNQPVTVQANYTDVELSNVNEEELKLYYLDSERNEWVPVQSSVDVAANKVVADLNNSDSFNKLYVLMAPAPLEASAPPTEVSEPTPPGLGNLTGLTLVALIVLVGGLGLRQIRQGKARSNRH